MSDPALEHAAALHRAGRLDDAEAVYRQILKEKPNDAQALNLLGVLSHQRGDNAFAVELIDRAIALIPNVPAFYLNLAAALHGSGKRDDAIAACERALALKPDFAEAYLTAGQCFADDGQLEDARDCWAKAVEIRPDYVEALHNLATLHERRGELADAEGYFRRAIDASPQFVLSVSGYAGLLDRLHRFDEAVDLARRAVEISPQVAHFHHVLGVALADAGRIDEAIAALSRANSLGSTDPNVNWHLALALLLSGDLRRGFELFETRRSLDSFQFRTRVFDRPEWDGSPLDGKRILLIAEQGMGDTIQFMRYAPLVAARGGRVIVECHQVLVPLARSVVGVEAVVERGQSVDHDVWALLPSLPRLFQTTRETIPATVPYVSACAASAERFARRIRAAGSKLNIGLAWGGSPTHRNDAWRSSGLAAMAPLAAARGGDDVTFFSLLKGPAAAEAIRPPPGMRLIDLEPELETFDDTAGAIASLDLVISVDTGVAHLSGAMNRPVWTLINMPCDWRWMLDRPNDTPWYPSMRLFRQNPAGDWTGVMRRVADSLRGFNA